MSNWQAIDTAPENTKMLIWLPGGGEIPGTYLVAIWQRDEELKWWTDDMGYEIDIDGQVSHWMPLPEPPK